MPEFQIIWTSERSVWIELGDSLSMRTVPASINETLTHRTELPVRSITPVGTGLLVEFSQGEHALPDEGTISRFLCDALSDATDGTPPREHLIRVCYDERVAPDLAAVAEQCGLSCKQVIETHQSESYLVDSIGYAPGFGYLKSLDSRLQVPRRPTPRTQVPAGSIGIADRFTAVYPSVTPGGWNLIGRTTQVMFDARRAEPCVFRLGDSVRFESIPYDEFESMREDE